MNKQPTSINELYAFFVPNLAKPSSKSNYMCSGYHLSRIGWHVEIYQIPKGNDLSMWFYTHPNRGPKWVMKYGKYMHENETTCKHR